MGCGNQRFPKTQRLATPADYRFVFDQPLKSIDRYFIVLARRGDRGHPRLGLAFAKKKIKRAVDRNQLKRLARESFRNRTIGLDSLDIIVLANRDAGHADLKTLRNSLDRHWQRLVNRM